MGECITRQILNWTEEKTEEIIEGDVKHPYLKAFGLGCIEGLVDGAVLAYPILVASLFLVAKQKNKNV